MTASRTAARRARTPTDDLGERTPNAALSRSACDLRRLLRASRRPVRLRSPRPSVQLKPMEASLPRVRRLAVSTRSFRRLALASAVMLVVIVALGRDRPADRLRARLRALARVPGRRPVPEEGLPLVHRVLEPDRRRVRDPRDARDVARALLDAGRCGAGCAGWRGATFLGTLAAGAARRDHGLLQPQPVARRFALPALARSCSRSACSSCSRPGTSAGAPVPRYVAGSAPSSASRAARCSSSAATSRPRPGRTRAASTSRASGASSPPSTCTCARPRCSAIAFARPARLARLRRQDAICAGRSSCSGCSSCRWSSARSSTGPTCRWWLVLLHVTLAALVWAAAVVVVATLWRPSRMT